MARKSFVELEADLATSFPDNITKAITPKVLRDYFTNFLHAIRPAYATLDKIIGVQVVNIAAVPLVFDTGSVSDVPDYTVTPATGLIDRLEAGTTSINFSADVQGPNSVTYTFQLYKNGVGTPWVVTVTTTGTGNPVSCAMTAVEYEGASADYQIYVSCEVDATNTTFSNLLMVAETIPVNAY